MYFFLNYLSLSDLCYTSTVTPKLITDLLAERKTISYSSCMTQLFILQFLGGIEIFVLTRVAYDRYAAVCRPLHYTVTMSRQRCNAIILACCTGGFMHSASQFLLTIFLPFCGPNEVDRYFCNVYPLLKLACSNIYIVGLLVVANSGLIALVTFVVLLMSYFFILHSNRAYSMESRSKALSTCSSHITVVVLFFAPALFIYIRPATTFPEDKMFALFYTIIAPMFNPLIFMLRNVEMKDALRKIWCHHMLPEGKLFIPWFRETMTVKETPSHHLLDSLLREKSGQTGRIFSLCFWVSTLVLHQQIERCSYSYSRPSDSH
ncbi:olfactory receptor 4P4-like protein [Camelus ferus]|nr:olfactory receptor 4P4-like protein [Camelus ferus]